YTIRSPRVKNRGVWGIAAAAFIAILALDLPFPLIVLGAGLAGWIGGRVAPAKFATGGAHGKVDKSPGAALIDDGTPTPEHARFRWPRFARVVVVGFELWAGVLAIVLAQYGWHGTLTQMGWFFTKAALLTFGGAYAVLPYVF